MKAVYISEYGGPDKLAYGDAPEPEIGREQVLVQVRACALNRREMFVREGSHGTRTSLSLVLGMEGAGEVVQVGDGVPNFRVGDRVLGGMPGAYAEYARSHYMGLYPIPDEMSLEEANWIYGKRGMVKGQCRRMVYQAPRSRWSVHFAILGVCTLSIDFR